MVLEQYIIAQERVPNRTLVRVTVVAVAVPVLLGVLILVGVVPVTAGPGVLCLVVAAAVAFYFLGWSIPVQHVLTDTHLLVRGGFLNQRRIPVDQIQTICQASRDDELVYSGFHVLGEQGQPVIINPHRPPQFRVAFTPSRQFIDSLFWATSRKGFDLLAPQDIAGSAEEA